MVSMGTVYLKECVKCVRVRVSVCYTQGLKGKMPSGDSAGQIDVFLRRLKIIKTPQTNINMPKKIPVPNL